MKTKIYQKRWFRVSVSLCLVLVAMMVFEPFEVSSEKQSQSWVWYDCAVQYERVNDYVQAGICLDRYKQANPPEYANDANFRKLIENQLAAYSTVTRASVGFYDSEIYKCGRFPCQASSGGAPSLIVVQNLLPPPNAVMVCSLRNYEGYCKVLFVGRYASLTQNNMDNQISSILVGNKAMITLYLDAQFGSQYKTFTTSDPDLSNDRIDSKKSWDENASSAIVQNK